MLCRHQLDDLFAVAAVLQPESVTSPQCSAPTCCAGTSWMTCLLLLQFCGYRALPHPDSSALRAEPPEDARQQELLQGRAMEASEWRQVLRRGQAEEWSWPCGHFQVGLPTGFARLISVCLLILRHMQ